MSWSVSIIGKPEKVVRELSAHSDTLTGQSKIEYEEARPHLQALVLLTVGAEILVNLNASGHGSFVDNTKTYGSCNVSLAPFYARLAI